MARWLAELSVKIIEVDQDMQGHVFKKKQVTFETAAEEPGTSPASALDQVIARLQDFCYRISLPESGENKKES